MAAGQHRGAARCGPAQPAAGQPAAPTCSVRLHAPSAPIADRPRPRSGASVQRQPAGRPEGRRQLRRPRRRRRLHRGQRRQRPHLRQPRPGRHHRRQLRPVQPRRTPTLRPDGTDLIFGGAGTASRDIGDATIDATAITATTDGHASDSDMIVGDNGRHPPAGRRQRRGARRRHGRPRVATRRLPDVTTTTHYGTGAVSRSWRARCSCSTTRRADRVQPDARRNRHRRQRRDPRRVRRRLHLRHEGQRRRSSATARTTTSSAATATTGSPAAPARTASSATTAGSSPAATRNGTTFGEPLYGIATLLATDPRHQGHQRQRARTSSSTRRATSRGDDQRDRRAEEDGRHHAVQPRPQLERHRRRVRRTRVTAASGRRSRTLRRHHLRRPGQRLPARRLGRRRDLRRRGLPMAAAGTPPRRSRPRSAASPGVVAVDNWSISGTPAVQPGQHPRLQPDRPRRPARRTHAGAGEFALYDEYNPLRKIMVTAAASCEDGPGYDFLLNFSRRGRAAAGRTTPGNGNQTAPTGRSTTTATTRSSATSATTGSSAAPAGTTCTAAGATTC